MRVYKSIKWGFLTLLFIISLNKNSVAQSEEPHIVKGTIVDEYGDPAPGVKVELLSNDTVIKVTVTAYNGTFYIKTDAHGKLKIRVTGAGYQAYETAVVFNNTQELSEAIQLKANASIGPEVVYEIIKKEELAVGKVTKVDGKTIQETSQMGAQEAITTNATGINSAGDDGMGNSRLSIGIRGLNPRRSARVLFLEDGIPINPGAYIYPNMYYNPPIERVKEIEITKGNSSIEHGPQTMGGVINYITSRPRDTIGGNAALIGGTNGLLSTFVELGGWGNEKDKSEVQLLYKRGSGYRDNNDFSQYNLTYKNLWKPNNKKDIYFKVNYNHEKTQATYTGLTEWSFENEPTFNPKENDEFIVNRLAADIIISNFKTDSLLVTTKMYGSYFGRNWWRENDVFIKSTSLGAYEAGFPIGTSIATQNPTSNTDLVRVGNGQDNYGILREFFVLGAEQSYKYWHHIGQSNSGVFKGGARLHWESFDDQFRIGNSVEDREGALYTETTDTAGNVIRTALDGAKSMKFYTTAFSAFVKEEMSFKDDRLKLSFGTRLEAFEQELIDLLDGASYSDKTTVVLLPGAGFNYHLKSKKKSNRSFLYGGVHRGFTPPSSALFNLPFVETSEISDASVDLVAEKSWNYELGFRTKLQDWIVLDATGFYLNIEDMVTAARSTVFIDLGKIESKGIEFASRFNLSEKNKWLPDVLVNYTYLKTKVKSAQVESHLSGYSNNIDAVDTIDISGNELPYAPNHTVVVALEKKLGEFKVRTDMKYVSDAFSDLENLTFEQVENNTFTSAGGEVNYLGRRGDAGPIPSYSIFNVYLNYTLNEKWSFNASVKNIFDQVYIASRLHSHPSRPSATASSGILVGARRQVNLGLFYKF